MSFLPSGYEKLKTDKKYWKPSQFKDGETKFRIMQTPICGWIDWLENKPYRYKSDQKPKTSFDPTKPIRAFWACYVWDYEREDLYILDIQQGGIIKCLVGLATDQEWGDFRNYDIKVKKEGSGKDTKYSVNPIPPKPVNKNAQEAISKAPVRLEALYEGLDPWETFESNLDPLEDELGAFEGYGRMLSTISGMPEPKLLSTYLEHIAPKLPKPLEDLVDTWLTAPDPFLKAYRTWLAKRELEKKSSHIDLEAVSM